MTIDELMTRLEHIFAVKNGGGETLWDKDSMVKMLEPVCCTGYYARFDAEATRRMVEAAWCIDPEPSENGHGRNGIGMRGSPCHGSPPLFIPVWLKRLVDVC